MLTKLITGFGCCMEHYVGEEPKSEANCCGRKRALFTGEGAEYGGAEIHRPPKRTKNDSLFQISLSDWCFSLLFSCSSTFCKCFTHFCKMLRKLFFNLYFQNKVTFFFFFLERIYAILQENLFFLGS